MDRPRIRQSFRHRKLVLVAGGLFLLSGVAFAIAKLEPGAPAVAREQLYLDEVKEGTLERKVRGPGVLQPREARWLSTRVEARVDRVLVRAGETVEPDTVIVQLSNPEVERAADAATLEVAAARAEYAAARLELESQRLDRRSSLAEARATAESARLQAVAEERAFQKGAVSELQYSRSKIEAGQLGERAEIEQQRLPRSTPPSMPSSRRARRACGSSSARPRNSVLRPTRSRSRAESRAWCRASRCRKASSSPRARTSRASRSPARCTRSCASPSSTPATWRRASRPSSTCATASCAAASCAWTPPSPRARCASRWTSTSQLPTQARADLSVDGTIAIETLANVRYVGRPVGAQSDAATTVFRAKPGNSVAERVPVKFGKASVNQIVVLEGLEPGDIVALADTTQWSGKDRLVID